jgi:hypothetical protein
MLCAFENNLSIFLFQLSQTLRNLQFHTKYKEHVSDFSRKLKLFPFR